MKRIRAFLLVLLLVIFDQFTKFLAKGHLEGKDPFIVIKNVFQLCYLENTGAAFGIFQNQIAVFAAITIVTLGVILFFYQRIPVTKRYMPIRWTLIFISAGAIGNLIDRIRFNYVVDFFYFELIDFPIFNVADCYVTVSAFVLAILFLFYYKEEDFDFLNKKKGIES